MYMYLHDPYDAIQWIPSHTTQTVLGFPYRSSTEETETLS